MVTSGPVLPPDAIRQNTGTFYQDVDMLGAGVSQGSMGLGIVQVSQTPACTLSMLDPVSGHIPVKIKGILSTTFVFFHTQNYCCFPY